MNRIIVCLIALLLFHPAFAATEVEIVSEIEEVQVYRQGAMITERGSVKVTKGDNLIIFSGISRFIVTNSITVKGEGAGVIQSVTDRVSYLSKTAKPARMVMLEDSLEALDLVLAALADEKFVLDNEQALILKNNQTGGTEKGVTAQELQQLTDLYHSRLMQIRERLRAIALRDKKLRKQIADYNQELAQITAQRNQPTQQVVVAFQATASGTVTMELRYLVQNAGWNPFYDIRVASTAEPLQLYLKANVVNNTGIDWKQVKLRLSTTQNQTGNQSPTLSPWYVDVYQPVMYESVATGRSRPAPAPMANVADARSYKPLADSNDEGEEAKAGYAYDYTETTEGELGLDFAISLPYDVPADAQEHQVDIMRSEVKGDFRHYAVPKADRDAFLVAYIHQDLLRGKANVYFEGTFVGETQINTDNPTDSLKISLGRDAKVQIQREQVQAFSSEKVIGSNIRKTYGYEITVKNNKTTPVRLNLLDQVPVSQNKDIVITALEVSGGTLQPESGRISWDLDLKPGETRKVTLQFEVKYPKDQPVTGL
ncbi:MAG: DUF4139 domain-containing protein [Bacteroidia bacterium]|nr:DUF4139 domain-containing protein [Bacteroidia bacterium]